MSAIGVLKRLGSATKTTFAVVGAGTSLYLAKEYASLKNAARAEKKSKNKNVLILPFHRMKIVEQKKVDFSATLQQLLKKDGTGVIEVELRELVNVIHTAATDDNIVALHGEFGHGFGFQCGGYAHIEEIRNAIRYFNESHRQHYERSKNISMTKEEKTRKKKMSYAFADSFDHPTDTGNKEYILASSFSHVNLQPRGSLQFYGVSMTGVFFADALKKNGIIAHVFKHGQFKNAPNSFTESGFTRPHYENTSDLLESINQSVYEMIEYSRSLPTSYNKTVWKAIHDYGTMTAENAKEINLIDNLPKVNPVFDLVRMNASMKDKSDDKKNLVSEIKNKFRSMLEENDFDANGEITFEEYATSLKEKQRNKEKYANVLKKIEDASKRSTATESISKLAGVYNLDNSLAVPSKEKVALIHVGGGINNKIAMKVIKALKEIKSDDNVKCIVLRINSPGGGVTASETILEECKDTNKPIICSFGNLAASGGYYIATSAEKIFANKTSITGSIGVFGIKLDASEMSKRYGINFDDVSRSEHSQTYSLFHPLNDAMKTNLTRNMDRVYQYFKQIVSAGRNIPIEKMEEVAQGRVWSGSQAKEIALVDEFGGIDRALKFAISNYTSGAASVEVFPRPLTLKERLLSMLEEKQQAMSVIATSNSLISGESLKLLSPCSIMLTMNEEIALATVAENVLDKICRTD